MGVLYDIYDMRIYKVTLYEVKLIDPNSSSNYTLISDALKKILSEDEYDKYEDLLDKEFVINPDSANKSLIMFTEEGYHKYDKFLEPYKSILNYNGYVLYASSKAYVYKKAAYRDRYQFVIDVKDLIEEE